MLRKSISILLAVVMIVSIFTIIPINASAKVTDDTNYLMFQAGAYSEKFDEIFVDSYSKSFAKTLYDEYRSDTALMVAISAWEDLHIVTSPKYSFETGQINKKDFYKVILFDLFDYSNTGTLSEQVAYAFGNPEDIFKGIKNERTSFALSVLKKICTDNAVSVDGLTSISPKDIDLHANYVLVEGNEFADDAKTLSDVNKILGIVDDVYKGVSLIADYLAIKELEESTLSVLDIIINDTTNPGELRSAAQSYKTCAQGGYEKVLTAMTEGATYGLTKAFEEVSDEVWKAVIASIPGGEAVMLGAQGGRAVCNYLFSSDKLTKAYYQLEADALWEDAVTKALKTARNTYLNNKTENNAKVYMSAIDLFKDTVLLGFEYSEEILKTAANSELNTMTDFWFGNYSKCMSLINQVEGFKKNKWLNYNSFEDMVLRRYKQLYFPDYDSYNNLTGYQNIAITSIELTMKQDICVGDEGYIYDYIDVKANPDNHTEILNPTWQSSDESIIQFESDYLGDNMGDFKCLKEGTCTLTATQFPDKSATITVTVGTGFDNSDHNYFDDFEYRVWNNQAQITKYNGNASKLIIPSALGGYSVTSISIHAFVNCTSLTNITIPDSVTSIGWGAFINCTNLTNISIPDSVTSIGASAFCNCTRLTRITIPNTVTDIGYSTFEDCTNLKIITIPDTVTVIGESAFEGCTNLRKVAFGHSVTRIGAHAFSNCKSLLSITIPNSVTEIERSAFEYCTNMASISIPSSVTNIYHNGVDDGILCGCSSLSEISIPSGSFNELGFYESVLNYLGEYFGTNEYDGGIKTVQGYYTYYLPNTLSTVKITGSGEITRDFFVNCSNIENIIIGDSITGIRYGAFSNCTSLNRLTIGKNVRSVDAYFSDCGTIEKLYFSGTIDQWAQIDFSGITCNPAYYSHNLFIESKNYYEETDIVLSDVPKIGNYAFYGFTNLEQVTFANNTDGIGFCSFKDCTSLKTITLSSKNIKISSDTFRNCNELQYILGDYCIKSIGANTFFNCENLNEIRIGSTDDSEPLGYIQSDSFRNCKNLKNVFIGNDIASIGEGAFSGCSNLTNITIGKNVKSIGYYQGGGYNTGNAVFYGCNNLKRVDYLGTIDDWAEIDFHVLSSPFVYGDSEIRMYIDDEPISDDNLVLTNATQINSGSFYNWKSISSITIPDSVTSIGAGAFAGCDGLTNITIPESVTSIGNTAFYWSGLNSIIIPGNVIEIGEFALPHPLLILFLGSKEQWEAIDIGDGNYNFTLHYNCKYIETIAPNCEDAGYDLYSCSECEGGVKINYTDSIGHDCSEIIVAPTCIERGYTLHKCTRCNYEFKDSYTDKIPHDFVDGICTMCGKNEDECIESAHPYENNTDNSWMIHKDGAKRIALTFSEGTKTESGYDYIYLYNSSDEQVGRYSGTELAGNRIVIKGDTVRIRLTSDSSSNYYGFSFDKVEAFYDDCTHPETEIRNAREATCGNNGYTGDTYCLECGDKINEGEIIPATGQHTMIDVTHEATCGSRGYIHHYCDVCGYSYDDNYTEPTGLHQYDDGVCIVCGKVNPASINTVITSNEDVTAKIINVGKYCYYKFTPDSNGTINWYSLGESDTYGYLYDSDMNELSRNDDGGNGSNFSISYTVEANKTYILTCRFYSSERTGEFTVRLDYTPDKPATPDEPVIPDEPHTITDDETSVSIILKDDASLSVIQLTNTDDINTAALQNRETIALAFDIQLLKDGDAIQPTDMVTVKIPYDNADAKVYRVEEDNSFSNMNADYQDGYLVFNTDHFSVYVVTEEVSLILGDVDGDGEVTIIDATFIQRYLASLAIPFEMNEATADTDGDGEITIIDATFIQRHLASLPIPYDIGKPIN